MAYVATNRGYGRGPAKMPLILLRRGLGQTLPDGTLIKNITSAGTVNGTLCSCCPGYQNVTAQNAADVNACCAGNAEATDSCGNLWGVTACGDYIAAHQVELGAGQIGTTGCALPAFPNLTWNMDANWGAPGPGQLTTAQLQAPLAQYQPSAAPSTTPAPTTPASATPSAAVSTAPTVSLPSSLTAPISIGSVQLPTWALIAAAAVAALLVL